NELEPVHPAFRDRMEVIYLSSYTLEEKQAIARSHLIPKQLEKHGLKTKHLVFSDSGLKSIIMGYTREAGLRQLERELGAVSRKVARQLAEGTWKKKINVTENNLHLFLGPIKILKDERLSEPRVGVVTGLAWTAAGGDVLFVEALSMPGKGLLQLTGQLGEVMKESGNAALSYLRSRSEAFGLKPEVFQKRDIHIHFPEGSTPKEGPSAGLAMATALLSMLSGIPVRNTVAMTGEIDLRGDALAIGGLKEKSLAALRLGIYDIIIPHANLKDLEEIDPKVRKRLRFHPVKHVEEVFELALKGWVRPEKRKAPKTNATRPHRGQARPS
ncbi:MAG: S16 family serine protease, partial [Holophagaceae bacterium]